MFLRQLRRRTTFLLHFCQMNSFFTTISEAEDNGLVWHDYDMVYKCMPTRNIKLFYD